jgi:hypothetical protein
MRIPSYVPISKRRVIARQSSLYKEFMCRADVKNEAIHHSGKSSIMEYAWGFVVEEDHTWSFYAADVWRAGTIEYFERFLTVWKNNFEERINEEAQKNFFHITFDDGNSNYSCMKLGCLGTTGHELAKKWIADRFANDIFPEIVRQATDPKVTFRKTFRLH